MTDALAQLRTVLQGTAECAEAMKRDNDLRAIEGSQKLQEESETDEILMGRAYACAFLLLMAAQDHHESMARLLEKKPLTQFGFPVLVRAVLENCGRAAWLLDPEIDPTARLARGLTIWADSLRELAEVQELTGNLAGAETARQGIEKAKDDATRFGLEIVEVGRNRNLAVKGHELSTATSLADKVLKNGKTDYKVLSAYTHGTTYALLQNYDFKNGGAKGHRPMMSIAFLASTLSTAVVSFVYTFNLQVHLYGWDKETWGTWTRHALGVLEELMVGHQPAPDQVRR